MTRWWSSSARGGGLAMVGSGLSKKNKVSVIWVRRGRAPGEVTVGKLVEAGGAAGLAGAARARRAGH